MSGGVLRAAAVAAALVSAVVFGAPGTAYAHTELDNAVPAAGSRLEATPGSVQLTFTEPVDADLAQVVVLSPDGQDLAVGPARQSGPGVIQPVSAMARAGTVRVAYRVVSLDGHPVSGSYTFDVLHGDPGAAVPPGGDTAVPQGGGEAVGGLPTGLLLGAGAVLLAVAGGAVVARRRARSPRPTPQTIPPTS
jgi:copper resistance protein C